MNNLELAMLVMGSTITFVGVAFFIIWILNKRCTSIVMKNSTKIKELLFLNANTSFNQLELEYSYHKRCNSKRQLDLISLDKFFYELISEDESFFDSIISKISSNRKNFKNYVQTASKINSTATKESCKVLKIGYRKFIALEKRLFNENLLRPQIDVIIYCKATYISPQGRNYYRKEYSYNFSELSTIYVAVKKDKERMSTRQSIIRAERAKMTDSMRYDILKRDKFRCVICGSSATDGVQLHVDHIIPVSKGGQTRMDNLQTLCDRCNLGKSNKM